MLNLNPSQVVIIQDTREQTPLCLDPLPVEIGTMVTGDYCLKVNPSFAVIERKTVSDLLSVLGHGRGRFEAELQRLRAFPRRVVLCEGSYTEFLEDERCQIKPQARAGSIAAWTGRYCGFMFTGNRIDAEDYAKRFLMCAARELWEMSEGFREVPA